MVQKKAPDKHGSPAEPARRSHAKPEKRLFSQQQHHQEGRSGGSGGGDLKKMLKKSRSIKVLEESLDSPLGTQLVQLGKPPAQKKKRRPSSLGLPNYMKSTSSSDAKKEQAQVNYSSSSHNNTRLSDHLKRRPPSTGSASSPKPAKILARKSSLRLVRPAMKKILGIPLCPKINAGRATCSSTMKETTFPDHLYLSPGATEAEGTSVFKVCPYTYCSLNGHRHKPLTPLRCFLSARRLLLKTQKSMKLRRLPSFRKTEPEGEETEIGAGHGISSLVEDLGDDFFVEIYAKNREYAQLSVGGGDDSAEPVTVDETVSAGDAGEEYDAKIDGNRESPVDDSSSHSTSNDSFDQMSEFSPSEMEVLVNFLEFVECDSEDPACPTEDDEDYWTWNCCVPADTGRELADVEEGGCELVPEAVCLDWEEENGLYIEFDEIDYSEFAEDESVDDTISTLLLEGFEEGAEEIVAENEEGTPLEEPVEASTSTLEDVMGEKIGDELEDTFEEEEEAEEINQQTEGMAAAVNTETQETEDLAAAVNTEVMGYLFLGEGGKSSNAHALQVEEDAGPCEETTADETEDDVSSIDMLFCDVNPDVVGKEEKQGKVGKDQNRASNIEILETWEETEEGEESQVFEEEPPAENEDNSGATSELDDAAIITAATSFVGEEEEEHTDPRAGGLVRGKKSSGVDVEEELRTFNPRAPNFLPVEPEPESEKVDLRHQMMDDRKNTEEWMIDYALRRAVDKLGRGRKRKVALLVEAFETVAPVPPFGSALNHSTAGFAHGRPIQACS